MPSRRSVLAALGSGAAGALAGCSRCGETWEGHQLSLSLDGVSRTGSGWDLTAIATVNFDFPKTESDGVGPFDVAAYAADGSLLDYETVGGLRWGDVPDDARTESECGDNGSASTTATLSVPEVPRALGPRFVRERDATAFEPHGTQGFSGIRALRYAPTGTTASRATAANATATSRANSTTGPANGTSATAGTETTGSAPVTTASFEPVAVESLPWPEPNNQAVTETDHLTNVRFRTSAGCASRRGVWTSTGLFEGDLVVEWARPIPEGSCERPFLESASVADRRLTARVGLHEAPGVRCRGCSSLGYRLAVDRRGDRALGVDEVVLVHLTESGDLLERVVEPVGD